MSGPPALSIRRKLGLLILLSSALAMLCVAAAVVFYEATGYRPRAAQQLERQGSVLAEVLRPALDFGDPESATRYLQTLRTNNSQVAVAAVYDTGGRLFAADRRDAAAAGVPASPGAPGARFETNRLAIWQRIERNGELLGHLYLLEDLPPLYARLPQYGIMAGGVVLALFVVGAVLLGGVQRNFLGPLSALVKTTGQIASDEDYTIRAPVAQHDELGRLAQSFNQMIEVVGRREAALRESEERMRRLASAAFEGIFFSERGRIVDVNAQAARMLGCERADIVGRPVFDFVAPQSRATVDANIAADFQGTYEVWMQRADGSAFLVEVSVQTLFYQGRAARVSAFRDITERKRSEDERARLESQLLQAQKMEAVGRLAGGVAHDFNNALTVILGQVEMALTMVDPGDRLAARLHEIQRAGNHSADLTRQLLTFARRQTVLPKVLDLNSAVSGTLKMLHRLMGEEITIAWRPGDHVWPVKIDPAQVDQVLANLCVNARDAIGGVGQVTIETTNVTFDEAQGLEHPDHAPGDYVLLSVADNGRGIDKDALEHIFEPFFTTKGVGEGTGLGLATVFGIVKQNEGVVTVASEPGQGTTFRLYLPRVAGDAGASAETGATVTPQGRGETILLVEDEADILELGRDILTQLGYAVLTAGTPRAAIDIAASFEGPIALLITDVVMPEMNGRDLAGRLSAIRPGLKSLFVSGYPDSVIAHRGVLEEGTRFIQKPFSVNALATAIRRALEISR